MFRNYLKIAWRNMAKSRVFSFINIFGLTIGLTSCMLIAVYLNHELSYDKYHRNSERLFLLGTTFVKDGKEDKNANTPVPMAETVKREFPEVEEVARIMRLYDDDKTLFQYRKPNGEAKSFYETDGYAADPALFRMFDFDFIEGNSSNVLSEPNTLVISEEIASKLFGKEPALQKIVHISSSTNGEHDFKVTGVFRPNRNPTQFTSGFYISMKGGNLERLIREQTELASNNFMHTFLLLKDKSSATTLEAKFPAFVDKYIGKDLKAAGFYKKQFLVPVQQMHLRPDLDSEFIRNSVAYPTYLYVLASIAFFTLLIACINFMNLSTARSSKRSAEVGIRKVLGAGKHALVEQFLGESIMMSVIAFLFALLLTRLMLPLFSEISGRNLRLELPDQWVLVIGFLGLSILTGVLAGSYPAFYLSSFQPVKVLKGRFSNSLSAIALRKGLVVFQFIISVALIIASAVIANQMNYLRSADLGFIKDQQVIIPLRSTKAKSIYSSLKDKIRNTPQVENAGATLFYPGMANPTDQSMYREGNTINNGKIVHTNWVDESFLQTLHIPAVAGRLFSSEFPADTNFRMILNEAAISKLGFASPAKAIGQQVKTDFRGKTYMWTVIGVVRDFHFQDLHWQIGPYAFQLNSPPEYNYLIAHVKTADLDGVLNQFRSAWHELNPGEPFEYSFLDQDFQKNYESDQRLASLVEYFTIIAILISCLGLFGLATFSAEQRTKEIGVRKVLGASVGRIVSLLSRDFLKLVAISIVIATPLAWWAMNRWLQDFAYKTRIGWEIFVLTGLAAMAIAWITISFQAIRSAIANPSRSLRSE